MRFGTVDKRPVLLRDGQMLDLAVASDGRFSDHDAVFEHWGELVDWAKTKMEASASWEAVAPEQLGPPVPRPRQVFAIGLNYRPHAQEAQIPLPAAPMVFTKFPSCLVGPRHPVVVTSPRIDWEVELVVVIGRLARLVPIEEAWDVVAGLTVGQDISDRALQFQDSPPQFSLAKSLPGFGPTGPALVTLDELPDRDDLELTTTVSGEVMQHARTSEMIFDVPQLVAYLSSHSTLYPGDLIFTGTPGGVGNRREPPRYLRPGDELVSAISTIGELRNPIVATSAPNEEGG